MSYLAKKESKNRNFRKRDFLVFDIFASFQKNVQKGPFLCFFPFFKIPMITSIYMGTHTYLQLA